MKLTTKMYAVSALVLLTSGSALAEGTGVVTRSTADMEADLMRTYQSHGGPSAGGVMARSQADAYKDLMRDWTGAETEKAGTIVGVDSNARAVHSRSSEDAQKDLLRIWN